MRFWLHSGIVLYSARLEFDVQVVRQGGTPKEILALDADGAKSGVGCSDRYGFLDFVRE